MHGVNWDALGAIAEAIGAVAVLVTLAYLAVQVRASTKSTRSQTLLGSSTQYQHLLAGPTNSAELRSAFQRSHAGEQLTPSEKAALESWCVAMANLLGSTWDLAELGAFGEGAAGAEFEGLVDVVRAFVETSPYTVVLAAADPNTFHGRELKRHDRRLRDVIAAVSHPPKPAV
jgi:hypothetical protein